MQIWPIFLNERLTAPFTATSRLQSLHITVGRLPPSSSETFLKVSMHPFKTSLPVLVEPVNATFLIVLLLKRVGPISAPEPVIAFITPAGNPVSSRHLTKASGDKGVSEGSFAIIV